MVQHTGQLVLPRELEPKTYQNRQQIQSKVKRMVPRTVDVLKETEAQTWRQKVAAKLTLLLNQGLPSRVWFVCSGTSKQTQAVTLIPCGLRIVLALPRFLRSFETDVTVRDCLYVRVCNALHSSTAHILGIWQIPTELEIFILCHAKNR